QTVTGPANHAVVYQPAPLDAWSQQTIDLAALYQSLDWKLPSYSIDADHPVRQIDVSLIVSSNQQPETTWLFGPIEQDRDAMSFDRLVDDALTHPDQYYVYIAKRYYLQREYNDALQAYNTALSYDPNSAAAYFGIAQCKWKLGDFNGGMA